MKVVDRIGKHLHLSDTVEFYFKRFHGKVYGVIKSFASKYDVEVILPDKQVTCIVPSCLLKKVKVKHR